MEALGKAELHHHRHRPFRPRGQGEIELDIHLAAAGATAEMIGDDGDAGFLPALGRGEHPVDLRRVRGDAAVDVAVEEGDQLRPPHAPPHGSAGDRPAVLRAQQRRERRGQPRFRLVIIGGVGGAAIEAIGAGPNRGDAEAREGCVIIRLGRCPALRRRRLRQGRSGQCRREAEGQRPLHNLGRVTPRWPIYLPARSA